VAGFAVKRGVGHRGARLILVDGGENAMEPWATAQYAPAEAAKVVEIAKGAELPVIVYGPAGTQVAAGLAAQLPKARKVAFADGGNARGIAAAGFAPFRRGAAGGYLLRGGRRGRG
jgi:hypothetical protein